MRRPYIFKPLFQLLNLRLAIDQLLFVRINHHLAVAVEDPEMENVTDVGRNNLVIAPGWNGTGLRRDK